MISSVYSVSLFSPGQIAAIVIVAILIAALIGLIVYIAYLLHKRGVHILRTEQLQLQRNELLNKLAAMRSGAQLGDLPQTETYNANLGAVVVAEEEPEEDDEEEAEEVAEIEEFGEEPEDSADVELNEAGNAVRYNRSFIARITQGDKDLKARYSELKNCLMVYKGMKSRVSWKKEVFHVGRKSVAAFVVRGKTLCLLLSTDASLFDGTKYKVVDVSGGKEKALSCMFRITSDRKCAYAKELIDIVAAGFNIAKQDDYKVADFTLPYKSTRVLIKNRLIKVVGNITGAEVDDASAAAKGIAYNRSFAAKIIQSDDALKVCYSKVKNHILSYDGVAVSDTWKRETFKFGREVVAAFVIRGKTLCMCLATDPARYDGTKYKVEDLSKRSKNTNTPLLYRVKGERRITYAMQLIDAAFAEQGIKKAENPEYVDYAVPFTATETLVRHGLIKITERHMPKFDNTDKAQETAQETTAEAAATQNKE